MSLDMVEQPFLLLLLLLLRAYDLPTKENNKRNLEKSNFVHDFLLEKKYGIYHLN